MIDQVNLQPPAPSARALAAARAAILAEAARPQRSWKLRAGAVVAASISLALVVGVVALFTDKTAPAALAARWLTMALLGVVGPVLAWSAARPGSPMLRRGGWALAAASGLALLLTRPMEAVISSTSPEWLCTVSHLGVAVPAAIVALVYLLPNMAFDPGRSAAAGLSVGTTGALLGELLCARDAQHIALFHLSAWALAALAVVAVSSRTRRRSFAP